MVPVPMNDSRNSDVLNFATLEGNSIGKQTEAPGCLDKSLRG